MAKDYAKRVYSTARKPKKKRWRVDLLLLPVLICLCLVGYITYKNKSYLALAPKTCFIKIKTLFAHKKTNISSPKTIMVENDQETVHFEFYNTLPKMKVNPSTNEDNSNPPVQNKPE